MFWYFLFQTNWEIRQSPKGLNEFNSMLFFISVERSRVIFYFSSRELFRYLRFWCFFGKWVWFEFLEFEFLDWAICCFSLWLIKMFWIVIKKIICGTFCLLKHLASFEFKIFKVFVLWINYASESGKNK